MKNNFNGIIDRETFDKIKSNIKWHPYLEMAIANKKDKLIPLRVKKEMLPLYKKVTGDEKACIGCDMFIIYRLAYWFFESEIYYSKIDIQSNVPSIEDDHNEVTLENLSQNLNESENDKTAENIAPKQRAKRGTRKV